MHYPTISQVENANATQLLRWHRFLQSPGTSAIGHDDFEEVLQVELGIMNRINSRMRELGGITPELSKQVGWEDR